jgi:hypothetical protein
MALAELPILGGRTVEGHDAATFLTSMLLGEKPEKDQVGSFGVAENANDSALFA